MASEIGDYVRYREELLSAEQYAQGMGYELPEVTEALRHVTTTREFLAEFLQATGLYDEAIDVYIEREQDPALTNRDRGLVNYRLAKCYQALLEYGPDQPDVQELLNGTIQSALVYLEGEPEQAWALRLLDQVESDT